MKEFCEGLYINMTPSSVAHQRIKGQTEAINGVILIAMKKKLEKAKRAWLDELHGIFWLTCTTPNSGTKDTLFSLAFKGVLVF